MTGAASQAYTGNGTVHPTDGLPGECQQSFIRLGGCHAIHGGLEGGRKLKGYHIS